MEFENIKVDDKVLVRVAAPGHLGWFQKQYFFVHYKVLKVTPAQFTTAIRRYRKSDGHCIGSVYFERAYSLEEKEDETDKYNRFVEEVHLIRSAEGEVGSLEKSLRENNHEDALVMAKAVLKFVAAMDGEEV